MMGPYKCPECGVWWAGLEHRCQPNLWGSSGNYPPYQPSITGGGTSTVRCTCPEKRGDNYRGTCLVHDVQITYTA